MVNTNIEHGKGDMNMEYRNLPDNIRKEEFNERAEGVLNWIKENREQYDWAKDPNAYEMTNLFLLGAKYGQEKEDINLDTLKEMWEIRCKDFENTGVSKNNFVYQICEDSYIASQEKRALVNDESSHQALRKMSGIGLHLQQQKRDDKEIEYNNPNELLELLESSKVLKGVHPELFEKYKFSQNLDRLVELQPESSLSKRIRAIMNEISIEKNNMEEKDLEEKDDMELE